MRLKYFQFVSSTRILLASFFLAFLFVVVIFPSLAGNIESLDTRMDGYDFAEVMAALEGYGADGRGRYIWVSLILDTLFPIIYFSLYAGLIYRFAPHEKLKLLAYLPLIGGVVDLGENIQIVTMLVQYPDLSVAQVTWANHFTLTKFAFSRVSMILALLAMAYALVTLGIAKFKARKG